MARATPPRHPQSKASSPAKHPSQATRILIVEDDAHMAQALQAQIEDAGFNTVAITGSGLEAIRLAEELHPDLVLMDIILEGDMDGVEATRQIVQRCALPVLYLTTHADQKHFERAKITEPFAYLLKPVNQRELVLTIEMALYRHKLETQLRNSEKHLADAQRIGHLGSWDWSIEQEQILLSDEAYRILGLPVRQSSMTLDEFITHVHGKDRPELRKAIQNTRQHGKTFSLYHRILRPNGQERILHHTGEALRDSSGAIQSITGTLQDVTELKSTEARLWHIAHHDPLCDLPNRMLMYDRLSQTLARARRNKKQVALMLFDLDDFKQINDTYGHQAGDNLLIEISNRMRQCVRDSDTIARLAGDEFTLIIDQLSDPRDAASIAQKIINALQEPINLDGQLAIVTCSIGIALYPGDAEDMEGLLKTADHAMYESKRCGKNAFHFYTDVKRKTH